MKILRAGRPIVVLAAVMVLLMLVAGVTSHAASSDITIKVDGTTVSSDADPYIDNGRTMVPIATIVNYLGGTVTWDDATQKATLKYNGTTVILTIGSTTAKINGFNKTLDVEPVIASVSSGGGRTMVPLRFISESFGYNVNWDSSTRTVTITTSSDQGSGSSSGTTNTDTVKITQNISSVSVDGGLKVSGDATHTYTVVSVTADSSLENGGYTGEWLTSPYRYFVDYSSTGFGSSIKGTYTCSSSDSPVSSVRTGVPQKGTARIVVDLGSKTTPKVYYSNDGKTMFMAFVETAKSDAGSGTGTSGSATTTNPSSSTGTGTTGSTTTTSDYNPYADGKLVVCIDPGHGSTTGGKRSPDESLREWEFNRTVAYKLKALLEAQGVQVIMTVAQNDMTDPSLSSRVAVANNAGDVDLFVSIHANAYSPDGDWTSAVGWEVYSYKTGTVASKAAAAVEAATNATGLLHDRGYKTANFYVIKYTTMPSILIEHGFYTNYAECQKMKTDSFRSTLAQADCTGIMNFFAEYK